VETTMTARRVAMGVDGVRGKMNRMLRQRIGFAFDLRFGGD
jgi:hypothetical protein